MPPSRVLVTTALAVATSLASLLGVAAPPTASASARASAGYTYTTMVAGTPDRTLFDCALNNLGQVAVVSTPLPGRPGYPSVARADGLSVTPIAGPGSGLSGWPLGVAINDSGHVAFGAILNGVVGKIVLGDGGPVRVVARSGPGEVFFQLRDGISLNALGRVAFIGVTPTSAGIYTGNGVGPLATRFLNTDTSTHYGDLGPPVLNTAGQIAFGQRDAARSYSMNRIERDGSVTRLYRSPQRSISIFSSMNRAGRVVISRPVAINTVRGAVRTLVASTADGFTAINGGFLNDGGQVAFNATTGQGTTDGLYTGATPSFTPVVLPGDLIDGHEVYLAFACGSTPLNNAGQIAFKVTYRDFTQAVVRADPVA